MATVALRPKALKMSDARPSTRQSPPGSLDLSDLPGLIQPAPPSNTLLITNLQEPSIFHPTSLQTIRDLLATHCPEPILHFVPLKSFRRIIVAFPSIESAIAIRQKLDGETLMGCRIRVYFGVPTPLEPTDQHLQAPKSDKLFFISPPPSPPAGWEMRNEGPPNKDVHAEDLSHALSRLTARRAPDEDSEMADSPADERTSSPPRQRSGSTTIVYHPQHHGHSPDLPAISVEDTTISPGDLTPMEVDKKPFLHTARPPVELMDR
ncbi:calcineurin binding protein-like protein [Rhizodiscina lignyota]|uniref:Calcineurin binding protein-like protein n=1 Tax=Rhizodiscina lignyota TaxID=1504668 RepID=A0A9P4IFP5_9PEZI|nr:calcineurin binding protein-like protein [Rhizodiscina lignyota]